MEETMIRLLVDSASDILQNNAENIYVVPLSINILDKDYLDGVEINNDDFYTKLTSGKVYSKTAACQSSWKTSRMTSTSLRSDWYASSSSARSQTKSNNTP